MPWDIGERVARMEEAVRGLADQVGRNRERVHELERITERLVTVEHERERAMGERQHRLELHIRALTLVVAVAGIVGPLIYQGVVR